jgi:hypothetical protein
MELRCQCECGERFLKKIEKPTATQVAEEMYYGFIAVTCDEHKDS